MAEFKVVMEQAKKMCKANPDCDTCPILELVDDLEGCPFGAKLDVAEIERVIMEGSQKNG